MQFFPLLLRQGCLGAVGAAHPGIDLVLDPVVIGRTEEQFAHKDCQFTRERETH